VTTTSSRKLRTVDSKAGIDGSLARDSLKKARFATDGFFASGRRLDHLVLKKNKGATLLPVDEIDWMEGAGVYVQLHVGAKTHLYRGSLNYLLARLDPYRFLRIHRSTIVNIKRIKEFHRRSHGDFTLRLKDGTELLLTRYFRRSVEQWLQQRL